MKILLICLCLLLSSCIEKVSKSSSSSSSSNTPFDSSSTPIIWTSGINTGLDVRVSQDFNDPTEIENMMDVWNDSTNSFTFFKVPSTSTTNKNYSNLSSYYDSEMGVYKVTNWFSGISSFALAITQFFGVRRNVGTDSEHLELIHADVMFNYENYASAFNSGTYDLQSVALHELGHFLGFQHHTSDPSIMYPSLSPNTIKRTLYTYDINRLYSNYNVSSLIAETESLVPLGASVSRSPASSEGNMVQGIIELRADGECLHYLDGHLVKSHRK